MTTLTPEMMINAYAQGYFPMAEPDESDQIYWWLPETRALLPIGDFHIPRRLARTLRQGRFEIRRNVDFEAIIRACADRGETWLSEDLIQVFLELHRTGWAHSIGAYHDGELCGGLYGLALGRAFFAESMYHTRRDASKAALVGLVKWLAKADFALLDVQFMTDHLRQFGAYEVDADAYDELLDVAISTGTAFE
ncbi:MAG: leucyl/phenylalanyl-tRNA--protein transferase [Rhodothermales bacterium]